MKRLDTDHDMMVIMVIDPSGGDRLSGVSNLDGLIKVLSDQMGDIMADRESPFVDDVKPSERERSNFVMDHAGRGPNGSSPVMPHGRLPDNYSDAAHNEVLDGNEVLRDVPHVRRAAPYVGTETLRFRPETVFAKRPAPDTIFTKRPASPFNHRDPAEAKVEARPDVVSRTGYPHANWRGTGGARHNEPFYGVPSSDGNKGVSTARDKLPSPHLLGGTVGIDTPPWQKPGGMGHALHTSVLDLLRRLNIDHGTAEMFADDFIIHWLVKVNGPLVASHI